MNPANITFNLHHNHNPDCDIVCYQLDKDTNITYGVYVKPAIRWRGPIGLPIQVGDEFMEVYVGENYNVGSKKRSYSRVYSRTTDKFPEKYSVLWFKLKDHYNNLSTINLVASKF